MGLRVPVNFAGSAKEGLESLTATEARTIVRNAVKAALRSQSQREAEVSVTLMDDAAITQMNNDYLGRNRATDVIAFPLYEEGEAPLGDVYIGIEQAVRQAASVGVPLAEELARLAVHGTLHVLGFDHPETDARVRSEMWTLQERIVASLGM